MNKPIIEKKPIKRILSELDRLATRWVDESRFEDFKEYEDRMRYVVYREGYTFIYLSGHFELIIKEPKQDKFYFMKMNGKDMINTCIEINEE